MDSDQGKLFIGGISWETTEELLKEYFNNYGEVLQAVVMRDKLTTKPRGFGFVVFSDPSILDRVLQDKHTIDGRTSPFGLNPISSFLAWLLSSHKLSPAGSVEKIIGLVNAEVEAKRALSREEQQTSGRSGNTNTARNYGGGGNFRTKKIFVGGLPPTLTEDEFRQYFEAYGSVIDVVVMYDQQTNRPRGFGFISFDSEDAVDRVLQRNFHDLNGKQVEVKRAQPKDSNPGGGGRSMSGGGGGGYQGSGGNSSTYDGRMDSNRYMQSQTTGGGFPPYGSSGYNAAGYGYGPASNGIAYGGYGGSASSAYGNLNVANAGYGSGPLGAPRSSWSTQAPSGYGGYGNAASWGAPSPNSGGGPVSATTGQSPSGPTGYGNQGYGYGAGYGGSDGSYGSPAAYSAGGGRAGSAPNSNASSGGGAGGGGELQGNGGGYMGGGYGDPNGNSGYGNPGWRVDPSQTSGNYAGHASGPHGGQVGYGGGYSAPSRQAQQQ